MSYMASRFQGDAWLTEMMVMSFGWTLWTSDVYAIPMAVPPRAVTLVGLLKRFLVCSGPSLWASAFSCFSHARGLRRLLRLDGIGDPSRP